MRPLRPARGNRVTQPIIERTEERIHYGVPSRVFARTVCNFVGGRARLKRDRASLGGKRCGAKLGDSSDPLVARCLTGRRRRDNCKSIALSESVPQNFLCPTMTEEKGCSKPSATG